MVVLLQAAVKQVWDAVTGRRLYIFEGHEAPVYSVCPHYKENIQVSSMNLFMRFLALLINSLPFECYHLISYNKS